MKNGIRIKESLGWFGKVIIIRKKGDRIIKKRLVNNLITNLGLNEIVKSLYNNPDMILKYVAIGDDDTAPQSTNTQLGNEIFRTPIVTQTVSGTGEVTSRALIIDSEPFPAVGPDPGYQCDINEIGFFAGSSATGTINSGTLISRLVLSTTEEKYDNEQISIERIDSIERG